MRMKSKLQGHQVVGDARIVGCLLRQREATCVCQVADLEGWGYASTLGPRQFCHKPKMLDMDGKLHPCVGPFVPCCDPLLPFAIGMCTLYHYM